MEFIIIDEARLKITLSKKELSEFGLTAETLDYSNSQTKKMFRKIIDRAALETGIHLDGGRVLVHLYTSKDGSCEIFFSKLTDTDLSTEPTDLHTKSSDVSLMAYSFEELEYLLTVCRHLSDRSYGGESSVYMGDDGKFYLFLELPRQNAQELDPYSFICEFGTTENTEATLGFVCEHCDAICLSGAVGTLSRI